MFQLIWYWIFILESLKIVTKVAAECSSCFKHPLDCVYPNCNVHASWLIYSNAYKVNISISVSYFKLDENQSVWLGLGVSKTPSMESSLITLCTIFDSRLSVTQSYGYNHGISPQTIGTTLTSQVEFTEKNGVMKCELLLHKSLLSTEENYLFVGGGEVVNKMIQYHKVTPIVSDDMISFTSVKTTQITDTLILLHGSAMMTAYGVFLIVAVYTNRYMRPIFQKAWFKIHTNIAIMLLFLALLGFGSILARQERFMKGPHEILGFMILILTLIQILLASLRPYRSHSNRKVIIIIHTVVGFFIFLLSFINILLGLSKSKLRIPMYIIFIQGLYTFWVVFGAMLGNEMLRYFYRHDSTVYLKKLKRYCFVNLGIVLLYGCTIIMLLNVID